MRQIALDGCHLKLYADKWQSSVDSIFMGDPNSIENIKCRVAKAHSELCCVPSLVEICATLAPWLKGKFNFFMSHVSAHMLD